MKRKIYFVGEETVNGEKYNTDKFNQVIDPDTQEELFKDIYDITDCADFEKYEHKEDFMSVVIGMAYAALSLEGKVGNEIIVTAIDAQTDIFLWGVKLEIIDDDNFKYTTLDWKANGTILKYVDEIKSIDTCCDAEKLFKDTYKKFLEDKVDAYAEIWYFHNPQVKELFSEDEFMELAKKSSRFVCKSDGKTVYSVDYHTVKQILFKEDEEKCYAYDKMWKEFVNGMVAYMKVQVEKVLKTLNGEVM